MDAHRAIDRIKYRFKCLFHTKEAIIIERRFIWTINSIIACCRSVYKSMRPILSQRERGWEGNKGCTGDSVRTRRVKRRPWMFKGFKRTAYGTTRNDKLEAHWGVSEEKIWALMPTWAKKRTVFVDRRALRADRAAITSHEAASLIYEACRFDDSSRFSGDYLSVFWSRLALKVCAGLFKLKMCSAARSVWDVYATLSSSFNVNAKQLISLVAFKHSTTSNVQKSPKSYFCRMLHTIGLIIM